MRRDESVSGHGWSCIQMHVFLREDIQAVKVVEAPRSASDVHERTVRINTLVYLRGRSEPFVLDGDQRAWAQGAMV